MSYIGRKRCFSEHGNLPTDSGLRFKSSRERSRLETDEVIIRQSLAFLEFGYFIFIASVCKKWKHIFLSNSDDRIERYFTYYGAALLTPSCLQFGCEHGIDLSTMMTRREGNSFPLYVGVNASPMTLQWMKSTGIELTEEVCQGASVAGRLPCLHWLIELQKCAWSKDRVAQAAASNGHLHILQWLWDSPSRRWSCERSCVSNSAALAGQTEVLKWLKKLDILVDEHLGHAAASGGNLTTLKWLKSQPEIKFGASTLVGAAQAGRFEVYKWLVDPNGGNCEINASACIDATFGGSVELLAWLKLRGEGSWEPNDMSAMLQLAGLNHSLPMVKWLRSQGAPWPVGFHAIAITAQRSNSSRPFHRSEERRAKLSFMCWRLESLKWAISQGCGWGTWSSTICRGLREQPFANVNYTLELEWAHANGCPCSCNSVSTV